VQPLLCRASSAFRPAAADDHDIARANLIERMGSLKRISDDLAIAPGK
jgi:hypothetical protein